MITLHPETEVIGILPTVLSFPTNPLSMSHQNTSSPGQWGHGPAMNIILALSVAVITVILCRWMLAPRPASTRRLEITVTPATPAPGFTALSQAAVRPMTQSSVYVHDTVVYHIPIVIITPVKASPKQVNGLTALSDPEAVLVMQTSDFIMDNPEERCLRKAIAITGDSQQVVMSKRRIPGKDFFLLLKSLGANEIIPLPSQAYGIATNSAGDKTEFGRLSADLPSSTPFIVWK